MTSLAWLIPAALALGLMGLAGFLWALRNGQFEDLDGEGWRAITDAESPQPDALADVRLTKGAVRDV